MKGWSTADPRYLCPCVRAKVEKVRVMFRVRTGGELKIIETARDVVRQREYIRLGVSKPGTDGDGPGRSSHLTASGGVPERPSDARVLACDMAPSQVLGHPKWDPGHPYWTVFGELAMARGMKWGRDWDDTPGRAPYDGWDSPHVYLPRCRCGTRPT